MTTFVIFKNSKLIWISFVDLSYGHIIEDFLGEALKIDFHAFRGSDDLVWVDCGLYNLTRIS